jgi:hypothetical protein
MRRLRLNEDMVRRIEDALDERKQQRRTPEPVPEFTPERRRPTRGRRQSDLPTPDLPAPPTHRTA